MAAVNFRTGTLAGYERITPDENTLYFITDAKRIYKGSTDVTQRLVLVESWEEMPVVLAHEGTIYLNSSTFEIRIKNGQEWIVASPGYLTDGADYAEASSDNMLGTIGLLKRIIRDSINSIIGPGSSDKVVISTANGITRSNFTIGTDTFTGSSTVLANEGVVKELMSWKSI